MMEYRRTQMTSKDSLNMIEKGKALKWTYLLTKKINISHDIHILVGKPLNNVVTYDYGPLYLAKSEYTLTLSI